MRTPTSHVSTDREQDCSLLQLCFGCHQSYNELYWPVLTAAYIFPKISIVREAKRAVDWILL